MSIQVKKFLVCTLIVTLIVTTMPFLAFNPSFANPPTQVTSNEILTMDEVPSLQETFEMYKEASSDIEIIEEDTDALIYNVEIEGANGELIESHIEASIDEDDSQIVEITEGDKTDTLVFDEDGTLYLDGEPVHITEETVNPTIERNLISFNDDAAAYALHSMYWPTSSPYGSTASYTKKLSTEKRVLTLSKAISSMTTTALIGIVLLALGIAAAPAFIISVLIAGVITWFTRNSKSSKTFSIIDYQYVHKTKGLNISSHMTAIKHKIYSYAYTNYTGYLGSSTSFQVWRY